MIILEQVMINGLDSGGQKRGGNVTRITNTKTLLEMLYKIKTVLQKLPKIQAYMYIKID